MGVEGGAHRLHKAVPVTQDGEFDEADAPCRAAVRRPSGARRVLGGEARLPDAAGAGQGDQAGVVETLPN